MLLVSVLSLAATHASVRARAAGGAPSGGTAAGRLRQKGRASSVGSNDARWRYGRYAKLCVGGAVVAVVGLWCGLRLVFFEGLCGSDDFWHVAYATHLDRLPLNHWESRLFYNAALHGCIRMFGPCEAAYALPGLLGSLAVLAAALYAGHRYAGLRGLLIAGLLAASLPLDVTFATVPFANAFAAGFVAVGAVFLFAGSSRGATLAAAVLFALGVLAHPVCVYFVLALCASLALVAVDLRRRLAAGACAAASLALFLAAELVMYALVAGDPLYEFDLLRRAGDQFADLAYPRFSARWFLYPVRTFFASKDFGVLPVLAVAGAVWWRHQLLRSQRGLLLACVGFWLWVGYGSQQLTAYVPFWRLTRYDYPLAMPLCVLAAVILCAARRGAVVGTAGLVGLHLGLLACSGPWGEGAKVARELYPYVQERPQTQFVTDPLTYRDLFVLNGCEPLPNLSGYPAADAPAPLGGAVILWNPAYRAEPPPALSLRSARYTTEPRLRLLGRFLPRRYTEGKEWWGRRPAGRALEVASEIPVTKNAEAD
jgi:hypothetical protein